MKTVFAILSLLFLFISCKKDGSSVTAELGSFPGALDSVVFYNDLDSGKYTNGFNILTYSYDGQQRVAKIKFAAWGYRLFAYQGNNKLPYMQVDSFANSMPSEYNYRYTIYYHLLTYDNANRVVADSIIVFERVRTNAASPETVGSRTSYTNTYSYQPGFMIFKDSRYLGNYQYYHDTTFYNSAGNVNRLKVDGSNGAFNQYVTEYYPDKNPFAELNIAPLYHTQFHLQFWLIIQNLNFNIFEPSVMYKKATGKNTSYYTYSKDDLNEVFFYFDKDANNKISHLVITNYEHYINSSGVNSGTNMSVSNFRFFYHQ
jgi:hypothetical protein